VATRVIGYKGDQVCDAIIEAALRGANSIMKDHVIAAKRLCPTKKNVVIGTEYRKGGFLEREISFTAYKGKKREKDVNFIANVWTGRIAGSLKESIRKVEKNDRPGNIRVYAGHNKVIYARFVEYGSANNKAQPFMRPSFQTVVKPNYKQRIEDEIRKVSEVK